MKKQLITLILSAVAFASCHDEDKPAPTPTPTPTNTIKVGSKFTFTRSDFDQTGSFVENTFDYTILVVRDTNINGETWFVVVTNTPSTLEYSLLKFGSDGLYNFKDGVAAMELKFNAAVNDTWVTSNGETAMVMAINAPVDVPDGSFSDAVYIETSDANSMENKMWYNNNQFMLKHEEYDEYPAQSSQMVIDYRDELKSVDL
ncbi:hypothetical protein [Polluticoccus soli]|uniref:hypothetical protein n=1 Tax=Polluticoccus soli TaxID=3034150 RepID=UPI0023E346B1|nr:hypothetical protein [Flavipsychrobacter sp. JY13-12]